MDQLPQCGAPHPLASGPGTLTLPVSQSCQTLAWSYPISCPGAKAFGQDWSDHQLSWVSSLLALCTFWDLLASITARANSLSHIPFCIYIYILVLSALWRTLTQRLYSYRLIVAFTVLSRSQCQSCGRAAVTSSQLVTRPGPIARDGDGGDNRTSPFRGGTRQVLGIVVGEKRMNNISLTVSLFSECN